MSSVRSLINLAFYFKTLNNKAWVTFWKATVEETGCVHLPVFFPPMFWTSPAVYLCLLKQSEIQTSRVTADALFSSTRLTFHQPTLKYSHFVCVWSTQARHYWCCSAERDSLFSIQIMYFYCKIRLITNTYSRLSNRCRIIGILESLKTIL